MELPDPRKITTDKIHAPFLQYKNVELDLLRLDKIHPVISGNKWFKLKYHLENFNAGNYNGIMTFGGAWSNHIVATACTCYLQKIKCVGIIRGEKPQQLSATLLEADKYEMELKFISREKYTQKDSKEFLELIRKEFPGYYIIPEGGAGKEGEKGTGEIPQFTNVKNYTHIACAVGTSTMMVGLVKASLPHQETIGVAVIKDEPGLKAELSGLLSAEEKKKKFQLATDYHFGGYAKHTPDLINFMNEFYKNSSIPTDFVYTGKLFFGILNMIGNNSFPNDSNILIIHSGGLQGNFSLPKRTLIF